MGHRNRTETPAAPPEALSEGQRAATALAVADRTWRAAVEESARCENLRRAAEQAVVRARAVRPATLDTVIAERNAEHALADAEKACAVAGAREESAYLVLVATQTESDRAERAEKIARLRMLADEFLGKLDRARDEFLADWRAIRSLAQEIPVSTPEDVNEVIRAGAPFAYRQGPLGEPLHGEINRESSQPDAFWVQIGEAVQADRRHAAEAARDAARMEQESRAADALRARAEGSAAVPTGPAPAGAYAVDGDLT